MARPGYKSVSLKDEEYAALEDFGKSKAEELNLSQPLKVPEVIRYLYAQYLISVEEESA